MATSPIAFVLFLGCVVFIILPGECRKCAIDKAEVGANMCEEALKKTAAENKKKFLTSPKQSSCCLTQGLGTCVEFAFKSARCSEKTNVIEKIIRDKLHTAQNAMTTLAKYISRSMCQEYDKSKCGAMMSHYDSAMKQIVIINSSAWIQASSALTVAMVILAYLSA